MRILALPLVLGIAVTVACGDRPQASAQAGLERGASGAEDDDGDDADDADNADDEGDDDEESIALGELPEAVVAAIEAAHPGADLIAAELDGGVYDVDVLTSGGDCLELEVKPDGTIVEVEEEDAHECA